MRVESRNLPQTILSFGTDQTRTSRIGYDVDRSSQTKSRLRAMNLCDVVVSFLRHEHCDDVRAPQPHKNAFLFSLRFSPIIAITNQHYYQIKRKQHKRIGKNKMVCVCMCVCARVGSRACVLAPVCVCVCLRAFLSKPIFMTFHNIL
jgi:hypothetical protein